MEIDKHVQDHCGGPLAVALVIHVCKVKKCFDQSKMKVCLAVSEPVRPILSILERHMHETGGKTLHGPKKVTCKPISINSMICSSEVQWMS